MPTYAYVFVKKNFAGKTSVNISSFVNGAYQTYQNIFNSTNNTQAQTQTQNKEKKEGKKKEKKEKILKKKIQIIFPEDMNDETKETLYCPISLDLMLTPMKTSCQHIFDMKNINEWIKQNNTCPVCRGQILDIKNLDVENNNKIMEILEKIKIKYKRKIYTYEQFMKEEYNYHDIFEFQY
jgi:hypothetical protein